MIMEKMNEALEEMKRVDHLIYVSLKYTRTVDVILNILNRMVDAYALIVDALLEHADEEEKLIGKPESAIERANVIKQVYKDDALIVDNMGLYILIRKLLRARHIERENEYRRHVTMKTIIDGREEIVNIDIITNYYLFEREFLIHTKNFLDGNVDLELHEQPILQPPEPEWMAPPKKKEEEELEMEGAKISPKTPPVRQQVKVRPISSAPRKRTPRPKKYKIQVPKEENPILRPPYEHDPKYNPEAREKAKKAKEEKAKKAKKKSTKKKRKSVKKKKPAKKAKKKTKKTKKSKKSAKKSTKSKKSTKKKATKSRKKAKKSKSVKKSTKKRKKKPAKKKSTKKKSTKKTSKKSSTKKKSRKKAKKKTRKSKKSTKSKKKTKKTKKSKKKSKKSTKSKRTKKSKKKKKAKKASTKKKSKKLVRKVKKIFKR